MKNSSFPEHFSHWVGGFVWVFCLVFFLKKTKTTKSLMKNGNFIPYWWHNHFSLPGSNRLHKEMILLGKERTRLLWRHKKDSRVLAEAEMLRELNQVEAAGSAAQPHHSKGTWVSTQHPNSWLHNTQGCSVRLVVGDRLCISAPNTLPSQPSSGRDQMCKNCRWAVFCTDQTKSSKAVQLRFTWENHQSLFQFGCFVHAPQSDHRLPTEGDVTQLSLSLAGGY